jgi:hypothetical protein
MRHVFLPVPVTAGAQGMSETAAPGCLIAPPGSAPGMPPGFLRTAAGTVNLAAVAATADQYARAGSGRTGKTGLACQRSRKHVDENGDGWNTAPAFVPSTVLGRGADPTWPLRISARPPCN